MEYCVLLVVFFLSFRWFLLFPHTHLFIRSLVNIWIGLLHGGHIYIVHSRLNVPNVNRNEFKLAQFILYMLLYGFIFCFVLFGMSSLLLYKPIAPQTGIIDAINFVYILVFTFCMFYYLIFFYSLLLSWFFYCSSNQIFIYQFYKSISILNACSQWTIPFIVYIFIIIFFFCFLEAKRRNGSSLWICEF